MTPEPDTPSPGSVDPPPSATGTGTEGGDSLPVYLDDDALEAMEGETVGTGASGGTDAEEAARLAGSDEPAAREVAGGQGGGRVARFSYFKALLIFLIAQLIVLLILGAIFRRPLSQAYNKLVDRGFIEPNALPWQGGGSESQGKSSAGDVAWEDVRRRHEMTLLADAAIARADRAALEDLRAPLDNVDDPVLRAAARAEVFRVQQMYATSSRRPDEPLPASQIFPGVADESEMSEEQIVQLLGDPDREVTWRIRAAHLLGGHRTLSANDALVLAVRKDPNLDVVKQAMLSFKTNTGYPGGDFFDAGAAEKWWAENAARLASEFNNPGNGEAPAAVKPGESPSAQGPAPAPGADDGPPVQRDVRPIPPGGAIAVPEPPAAPGSAPESGAGTPNP